MSVNLCLCHLVFSTGTCIAWLWHWFMRFHVKVNKNSLRMNCKLTGWLESQGPFIGEDWVKLDSTEWKCNTR